MFQHILIATDGSPLSDEGVSKGLAFAKALGAKVTILTVIEPFYAVSADVADVDFTRAAFDRMAALRAEDTLRAASKLAESAGLAVETVSLRSPRAWEAIVSTATAQGCDVISMASHGRSGFAAMMLGSVTSKVLAHSTISVLVFR